ncbi:uncharacterized protein Tco025E_09925 [Trypanosoma conorhini]|uniref:Uncharacterized protein n=1 Tax=Trypanosoma conorhini TaxID=83891 RepID=A0A422MSV9_9TRYP|nr:uncharacterized protein Tco025E_09925 [Trypanosoma conorhini]RNE96325.1 hypothetical protein Tco025E_09925 [Trypanosoma conorhini]
MECTLRQALGSVSRWAERNKHGAQRREGEVRAVLAPPSRAACGRTRVGLAWWRIASRGCWGGFDPVIALGWPAVAGIPYLRKETRLMKIKAVSAKTRGPKCERLRPPPKTLAGGSPNSSTEQWRAATRLRCRRWSAWRSSTPAPPASSLAFASGLLGQLLKRRLAFSRWEGFASMRGYPVLSAVVRAQWRVTATRRGSFPAFQPDTLSPPPDSG